MLQSKFLIKTVLQRALKSQKTRGNCRGAIKTKGKSRSSAANINLTKLQIRKEAEQSVRSAALAVRVHSCNASAGNTNNNPFLREFNPQIDWAKGELQHGAVTLQSARYKYLKGFFQRAEKTMA